MYESSAATSDRDNLRGEAHIPLSLYLAVGVSTAGLYILCVSIR
jgi:hypothetical protein